MIGLYVDPPEKSLVLCYDEELTEEKCQHAKWLTARIACSLTCIPELDQP